MRKHPDLARITVVSVLLLATVLLVRGRAYVENIPVSADPATFPREIGAWHGRDLAIEESVLESLGPGKFLSRLYTQPQLPPVDLFVAYFPSQRAGDTIHSPKHCLPGAGWTFTESGTARLHPVDGAPPITVGRYLLSNGDARLVVLYWYQAHGRAVVSEYWAKYYLVADAIRLNRTDGALVRVMTPLEPGERVTQAEHRAKAFAENMVPYLPALIPR